MSPFPIASILALFVVAGGDDSDPQRGQAPVWAEVIEWKVDPQIVKSADLRHAIDATGLPWRVRDARTRIEMLLVPPVGKSVSGVDANDRETGSSSNAPFYLGRFEVTQQQWACLMEDGPNYQRCVMGDRSIQEALEESGLSEGEAADVLKRHPAVGPHDAACGVEFPVVDVSRDDCMDFCNRGGFRLPTEEEWCAAVAVDVASEWQAKLDDVAWHRHNSGLTSHAVGGKTASILGFHDLLGNVWEWCAPPKPSSGQTDVTVDKDGRVRSQAGTRGSLRGGSWFTRAAACRIDSRIVSGAMFPNTTFGLRVARDP